MEIVLDFSLIFPVVFGQTAYDKLIKYCGSIEDVEQNFQIEFSCGDGKYFSDFWKWTDEGALVANWPDTLEGDEEVLKYDGKVCTHTPPRLNSIKMSMVPELMKPHTIYQFTIKYFPRNKEEVYYINNKERSRKQVK